MAFWLYLLGGIGIGWLSGKLLKSKEGANITSGGTEINRQSNIDPIPVVYGRRKLGGTRVLRRSSGTNNTYLYIALVLCEGEIEAIEEVYINDVISTDSRFDGLITINKHLGGDDQAADQMLIDANIGWTTKHRLRGVAYLAMRFTADTNVFGSMPEVQAVVKGRKVYDPRTSTTAYTTNNALHYRDFMTNSRFGKGLPVSLINDTQVIAAANKCDVQVTPYAGATTQNRFAGNVILDTSETIMENVRVIVSGMRGLVPYQNGQYGLIIEDEGSSTFSFTEDMIKGLSIQSETKKDKYNRCIVEFTNPDANWEQDQVQYPVAGSAHEQEYLDEDGGVVLENRVVMPTVTDVYLAEDMAELIVHRSRNGLVSKFTTTSEAMNVVVGQIVDVTHTTPGWVSKPFRVTALSLKMNGEVDIELVEHQDYIYPWAQKSEYDAYPDTVYPNPSYVVPPSPIGVDEELYITVGSKGTQARAIFNWAAPNDAFVVEYEVEFKLASSSTWLPVTVTKALSARIDDIVAGTYNFRVRSFNAMGVESQWATFDQAIAGKTALPIDVANFSIRALDGQCHLSWTRSTDLDVINGGFVRIRHSTLITGATWEDGQDIGEAIAGVDTYTVLPMLAGTYMAKFVDEGGRFSDNAAYAITDVPNIIEFNAVETATEHPSFAGTREDMIIEGSILKLDGAPRYILLENGDRLVAEDGTPFSREIGDIGVIEDAGTYYFANDIDLGGVYTSRVTAVLKSSTALATDLFDNRVANIDSWANFDGEPSDKLTAELQLRLTKDDPSGSPTWSDWQPFLVGDYHARAYEFRVVVTNEDANYNISITELSVTVDMPDRTERASDLVTSASADTVVTFNSAFHAKPVTGITIQDANSGDYYRLTSESRTGFTVNCYDSANNRVSRNVNWMSTGYGKEAV